MGQTHFLERIFKPENFKPADLQLVFSQFHQVSFKKNDYLINEGQVANFYFFVESGFARSYAVDFEGNDVTTNFYGPEDIVIDWRSYFLKSPVKNIFKR